MTVPVPDLPPPHELWVGPALLAALVAGRPKSLLPGYDVTADGLRMRDVGNGWWGLAPVVGGRAVLYGLDLDNSEIVMCQEPVDLLAGGPAWLPWSWLRTLFAGIEPVGFVYWWDGAHWARAPYPVDLHEDGCRPLLDEAAVALACAVESLTEDGDPASRPELLARLRRAAHDRTADRALFEAVEAARASTLEPAIDPDAALAAATQAGLTAGSTWPELPAGDGEPAGRTVPFSGADQHAGLVTRVMRAAPERQRLANAGREFQDLAEMLRADGPPVLAVEGGPYWTSFRDGSGRPIARALADLLLAAREVDADHDWGRWLYLRIDVTGPDATIERAYDHIPGWWRVPYHRVDLALLREEMAARTSEWRPDWAELLAESLAGSGVPPHLCVLADGR